MTAHTPAPLSCAPTPAWRGRSISPLRTWCAASLVAFFAGCGGGTDGTGRVGGDSAVTSSGVMTRGSVILNDTTFDAGGATVTDDRGRTANQLESGMAIKLRGRSNETQVGRADQIDVENELRAPIASIDGAANPQRFTAAGAVVMVDSTTIYAGVSGFGALAPGLRVEVHGLRDVDGWVRATRIEAVGAAGADELRGRITEVNTAARRIVLDGTLTVNYTGATFAPAGTGEGALAVGAIVEVRGTLNGAGTTLAASQVDLEALEDAAYNGSSSERQEVEGYVTGFTAHPGEFRVNGRLVRTTASTNFPGGNEDDLADNVLIEAEGTIDAQGVLVAGKIKFKRQRIVLQGLAAVVNLTARTLGVLGQTVQTNDLTRFIGGPQLGLGDIVAGVHCVDVRGHLDGTQVVAERVRRQNNCTGDIVQAPVTAKDTTLFTLRFFSGLNALTLPTTQYSDADELPLARDEFFARVRPAAGTAGTLVRVRGANALAAFAIDAAELKE